MFKNKIVLITGGSAGIGAATAELFAKEGASVAIVGRNDVKLKEVAERCKKYDVQAFPIKADLSNTKEVDAIVKQTIDKFGKLDILINNAAVYTAGSIIDDNFLDIFDEMMKVNMRGTARITYHAVPYIIETKGNIVNISSIGGHHTKKPSGNGYKTSKAALTHFSRCCAAELAEYGVRVNCISPGPVDTNMFDSTNLIRGADDLTTVTALKKIAQSSEIADLILYVASDKAKSITGSHYVIDNGGSAGIGEATAEQFAKKGASVAIVGRNDDKLKEVIYRCLKYGNPALAIKADLSKDEETDTIIKKTIDKFGKLDVLVNNAGILREVNIFSDNFLDTFDEIMNVNMRSPARITCHAVPYIIETKGNIVNVSSIAGSYTKRLNFIAYRTSKAALNHFTRCCAFELAQYGVRVNSISPGPVATNIFKGLTQGANELKATTALKKVVESEEVADLILYIASTKAKSITGSNYIIDNGALLI